MFTLLLAVIAILTIIVLIQINLVIYFARKRNKPVQRKSIDTGVGHHPSRSAKRKEHRTPKAKRIGKGRLNPLTTSVLIVKSSAQLVSARRQERKSQI